MNTQIELKPVVITSESAPQAENPMQERHIDQVVEALEMTAEAAFTSRTLESRSARGEAGPVFVP